MNSSEAYEQLSGHSKEFAYLGSTIALLHWDQRTQIPAEGHAHRVDVLSYFAKTRHRMVTDPRIGEWLAILEGSDLAEDPLSVSAVNIREWRRAYDRATKIPERLAIEIARATAEGQSVWEKARPRNDWPTFMPYLDRIVSLEREAAQAFGYEDEPYDALLEGYEQGETVKNLRPIFSRLTQALVSLLERIKGAAGPVGDMHGRSFPIADQRAFAIEVAKQIGYDFRGGRLDISAHPFTTGIGPGDVRITTRYSENDLSEAFFSVVHEAGHAIYHQGLPLEHWGTPFCRPISLGVNESQSRMWENLVARSLPFWEHFYPQAQARFASLKDVRIKDFFFLVNEVVPSLIRTEADEVTYNLHILLRFELEVLLSRGDLDVKDLPSAWNEKMEAYFGLTPPDYALGVMQDVHWSSGSIGYFPTYTLGNLYSAQFFAQAEHDLGNLNDQMARGEFTQLREWLRDKIHSQGSRYLPKDLVKTVTGEGLNPGCLIDYLERKYKAVYGM
ncbi:MAG: carboxypeptidase M32 [Desulfomonilaceae bacterium]